MVTKREPTEQLTAARNLAVEKCTAQSAEPTLAVHELIDTAQQSSLITEPGHTADEHGNNEWLVDVNGPLVPRYSHSVLSMCSMHTGTFDTNSGGTWPQHEP